MNLRRLVQMYRERMRVFGELAAWHLSGVAAVMPLVHAKLNPTTINPYRRVTRAQKKLDEAKQFIAGMALKVMAEEAFERAAKKAGKESGHGPKCG